MTSPQSHRTAFKHNFIVRELQSVLTRSGERATLDTEDETVNIHGGTLQKIEVVRRRTKDRNFYAHLIDDREFHLPPPATSTFRQHDIDTDHLAMEWIRRFAKRDDVRQQAINVSARGIISVYTDIVTGDDLGAESIPTPAIFTTAYTRHPPRSRLRSCSCWRRWRGTRPRGLTRPVRPCGPSAPGPRSCGGSPASRRTTCGSER